MSSRFEYSPLVLAMLTLHGVPALAQEAAENKSATPEVAAEPTTAMAADATELQTVTVSAQAESLYKTEKASSPKYTEPLRDTPKTITVVTKEVIEDQGLLSLREILSTVPGITFGAGEGGGGYGDSINIRGFNASGDVAIDGMRDSAQYTRSDPFNLESVEVTKGSSGAQSGSGAVTGGINLVSKTPKATDATTVSAGIGTDNYHRFTVDTNKKVGDTTAVRLNVMSHTNDVPGRNVETAERYGIAPSIAFGLGTDTRFTTAYLYQKDQNTPQYGVPYYNGKPVQGVNPSSYFGFSNLDIQESEVHMLTLVFEKDFGDIVTLRNQTRAGITKQYTLVDPPQGTWCLANGMKPAGWSQTANNAGTVITTNTSGYTACLPTGTGTGFDPAPGLYRPSGPRGSVRDTVNKVVANQTDAIWSFNTGPLEHDLVTGLSFTQEDYELGGGNVLRKPGGLTPNPTWPDMSIDNPASAYSGPVNYVQSSLTEGQMQDIAVYVFETLKFSPQWAINLGARYDKQNGDTQSATYSSASATVPITHTGWGPVFANKENLFSWSTGVVFKPVESGSIYISYSNSETPSKATVNGACTAATCNVDPEEAETIELGTKWDVVDNRLGVTAALFRTERTNYKVADALNPANPSGYNTLDGSSRVQGLELGISGQITDQWAVYANGTIQESEVLQGASDYVAAGNCTGTRGCDFTRGDELTQVPHLAASLWTTYDFSRQLQLGYGITYTGESYLSQHGGIVKACPTSASCTADYAGRTTIPLAKSEAYMVHNLSATYKFNRNMNVQLNVKNLLDEEYYTRIRNNGWATPGDARSAVATVNYSF